MSKKDRPVLRGAEEQNTLMWAKRIIERNELAPGNFSYHAERVLAYLKWKKYKWVKFSKKRRDKIALIQEALKIYPKIVWTYFRKRDIRK